MIWKYFILILLGSIKTLFAPTWGFAYGISFWQTWLATAFGAVLGFVVFYRFFAHIIAFVNRKKKPKNRQKQLKTARKIVTWKKKYPVWIFVFILPFMSIPVMAFVVKRFYNREKAVYALSLVAVVVFALFGCVVCSPVRML